MAYTKKTNTPIELLSGRHLQLSTDCAGLVAYDHKGVRYRKLCHCYLLDALSWIPDVDLISFYAIEEMVFVEESDRTFLKNFLRRNGKKLQIVP